MSKSIRIAAIVGAILGAIVIAPALAHSEQPDADISAQLNATLEKLRHMKDAVKPTSAWTIFSGTDPMTDIKSYAARTQSGEAYIQIECSSANFLLVGFHTKDFLGDGFRDATYRVDSKKAHTVTASYSDHRALPLCDGECKGDGKPFSADAKFLAELKGGTSLLLRLRTFRYESHDYEFQIDGAQDAIDRIRNECTHLAAEKKRTTLKSH